MSDSLTISAEEIGRLLQPDIKNPARWLQAHHAELTDKHGMPRRLPGGWVWSRLAVLTWIGTFGAPAAIRAEVADNLIRQQQQAIMAAFGRAA
jgi:hypothetical protein